MKWNNGEKWASHGSNSLLYSFTIKLVKWKILCGKTLKDVTPFVP